MPFCLFICKSISPSSYGVESFACDVADPLHCFVGSDFTKHSEWCGAPPQQIENSLRTGDCPFPRAMWGNLASLQDYISGTFFSSSSDSLITFSSLLYLSSVTVASRCFIASSWSWHTSWHSNIRHHNHKVRSLEWNQDKTCLLSSLCFVYYIWNKPTTRICPGQVVDITEVFSIWIWHICLKKLYYEGHIKRNIVIFKTAN